MSTDEVRINAVNAYLALLKTINEGLIVTGVPYVPTDEQMFEGIKKFEQYFEDGKVPA